MGSSCCTAIQREQQNQNEIVILSENSRKSSQKKNSKSSTNTQKTALKKTDNVEIPQSQSQAEEPPPIDNPMVDLQPLEKSKERHYQEQQLEDDEKTPGFANQSINHGHQESENKPIIFMGDTNQIKKYEQKLDLPKKNIEQLGNSPVKIFISQNSLKKLSTDQEKLNKLRSLSAEECKEQLRIKRQEKHRLSRSFSQLEEEKKLVDANEELQSQNSINMKKSILKKNLKYSSFKKTKTLKESVQNVNECESVDSKKKVRFDQSVFKKQVSKSKFH